MATKTLISLLALLGLPTLTLGQQGDEYCETQSIIVYDDILNGIEYYTKCSIPTHKLNASCILLSCPLLIEECPLTSGGITNETGLKAAMVIINTCLGQDGLICGINVSHIQKAPWIWTTTQFIPLNVANGTVQINNGTAFISNLEKAQIALAQMVNSSGPIIMSITATNVTSTASVNGNFALAAGSFLQPLVNAFPSASLFNLNHIAVISTLNVNSTVSIDLTTHPPTIRVLADRSNINLNFTNFVTPSGFHLPGEIVDPFNMAMDTYYKESVVYTVATTFLSTYVALALQGAMESCPLN